MHLGIFLSLRQPTHFPDEPSIYEGAKTSCAEYGVTYGFASPLQSSFPCSLPGGGDLRKGLARFGGDPFFRTVPILSKQEVHHAENAPTVQCGLPSANG